MKNKQLIIGLAGLLIGATGGYAIANATGTGETTDSSMHSSSTMPSQHMAHAEIEVDNTKPIPAVSMKAMPDSKDGYNLYITTENFTITPDKAGAANEPNTGHMHLYVNGEKIARVYGNWYHLSKADLKDGDNTVEISLNANDHSDWLVNGNHINATVTVTK
jgi:hypothetical protein